VAALFLRKFWQVSPGEGIAALISVAPRSILTETSQAVQSPRLILIFSRAFAAAFGEVTALKTFQLFAIARLRCAR